MTPRAIALGVIAFMVVLIVLLIVFTYTFIRIYDLHNLHK